MLTMVMMMMMIFDDSSSHLFTYPGSSYAISSLAQQLL
jgi:hypothetical protein